MVLLLVPMMAIDSLLLRKTDVMDFSMWNQCISRTLMDSTCSSHTMHGTCCLEISLMLLLPPSAFGKTSLLTMFAARRLEICGVTLVNIPAEYLVAS